MESKIPNANPLDQLKDKELPPDGDNPDFRLALLGLVFPPGGFVYWQSLKEHWPRRSKFAVDGAVWGLFLAGCLLIAALAYQIFQPHSVAGDGFDLAANAITSR